MLVVGFWLQRSLGFPLRRLEVLVFAIECSVLKHPGGGRRQHVDFAKECSILQHAATSYEFAKAARIRIPQVRKDREDRFCLRCEVESLTCLVVVNPMHAVTVIEKRRRRVGTVYQESVKPSV